MVEYEHNRCNVVEMARRRTTGSVVRKTKTQYFDLYPMKANAIVYFTWANMKNCPNAD
jgi:hypothetical protein